MAGLALALGGDGVRRGVRRAGIVGVLGDLAVLAKVTALPLLAGLAPYYTLR